MFDFLMASVLLCCRGPKKDVYLPVHLYGQLALHEEGMELLKKEVSLDPL
jgi:hypothetical protein